MLWKIPVCVDALMTMKIVWRCREKCKEMDAASVPATTISMGMFLTTYLRGGGVAAAASRRWRGVKTPSMRPLSL